MTELEALRLAYAECSRQRFELLAKLKNLLQEPEPVATLYEGVIAKCNLPEKFTGFLYTSPPKREWQGLTDEDLVNCDDAELKQARYWEAKLKEKNT